MPEFRQTSYLSLLDPADRDRREANPTRWEASKASPSTVNGPGYIAEFDQDRLRGQMLDVYILMKDGYYRTLKEIVSVIGKGSETGISAALRSFRKKQYGSHTVNKRRKGDPKSGLFEYQLVIRSGNHAKHNDPVR